MSDLEPPVDDAWVRRLSRLPDGPERDPGPCLSDEDLAARIERRHRAADEVEGHLARCPACRGVARELILDGAGDHPPALQPIAAPPPGWASLFGPWVPRRLAASGGGVAVALLAMSAMAAIAFPLATRMLERPAEPDRFVPTIWRVSSVPEPAPSAPPTPTEAATNTPAPIRPAVPAPRGASALRRRRPAPTSGARPAPAKRRAAAADAPAAILLPKLPTTKVVKPPPPAPPPPPPRRPAEPEAYTAADEVFFDEVQAIGILSYEGKFGEALERVARLRPVAAHSVKYTGVLNKLRNEAQRGLDKSRGPCKVGYVWQRYEKRGATEKWRCVLPEEAEKILDR